MSYQVISVKVDPIIKKEAKNVANELGLSLSVVLKSFLRQFIKDKTVIFNARNEEKPSQYLIDSIKKSEKNIKEGKVSPAFNNAKDAIAYLHKQGI